MSEFSCDSIIFDLDGTLWDTCATCAIAWNNVVKRKRIVFREITADDVRGVAGLPHEQCIRNVFTGLSDEQIEILNLETQTEDNAMVAELGGEIYGGVAQGLKELAARYPLFIVSNCQSGYIEMFFKKTSFDLYFRDTECWGNTGKSKALNLQSVVHRNGLQQPIFVGDTMGDQKAAFECGVPFWFVSYGFGQCFEFARKFDSFGDFVVAALALKNGID